MKSSRVEPKNLRWSRDEGQAALVALLEALPASRAAAEQAAQEAAGRLPGDATKMVAALLDFGALEAAGNELRLPDNAAAQLKHGARAVDCMATSMFRNLKGARELVSILASKGAVPEGKLRKQIVARLSAAGEERENAGGAKYTGWPSLLGWMEKDTSRPGLRLHKQRAQWLRRQLAHSRRAPTIAIQSAGSATVDESTLRREVETACANETLASWARDALATQPWGRVLDALDEASRSRPEADCGDIEAVADMINDQTMCARLGRRFYDWAFELADDPEDRAGIALSRARL